MPRTLTKALCLLIVVAAFANAPATASAQGESRHAEEAAAAVDTVAQRFVAMLRDAPLDSAERRARIEALMEGSLDLTAITNFVLGRHRAALSTAERLQFEEVFGNYVIATYARHVSQHPIQAIEIERTRQITDSTAAVSTRISRDEREDLVWTWRLHSGNNGYRVVDLQAPNISLAVTYRRHIGAAFDKTDLDSVLTLLQNHAGSDSAILTERSALQRLFGKPPDVATLPVQ